MDQKIKVQGCTFQAILKFQTHFSRWEIVYFTHKLYTLESDLSFRVVKDMLGPVRTNVLLPIMPGD